MIPFLYGFYWFFRGGEGDLEKNYIFLHLPAWFAKKRRGGRRNQGPRRSYNYIRKSQQEQTVHRSEARKREKTIETERYKGWEN